MCVYVASEATMGLLRQMRSTVLHAGFCMSSFDMIPGQADL